MGKIGFYKNNQYILIKTKIIVASLTFKYNERYRLKNNCSNLNFKLRTILNIHDTSASIAEESCWDLATLLQPLKGCLCCVSTSSAFRLFCSPLRLLLTDSTLFLYETGGFFVFVFFYCTVFDTALLYLPPPKIPLALRGQSIHRHPLNISSRM